MAHPVLATLAALVAVGLTAATSAQGVPTPAEMPAFDSNVLELGSPAGAEAVPAPMASEAPTIAESPVRFVPLGAIPMSHPEALSMTGPLAAATESSGTWLRRGLWYADLDAVVMARTWDSDGMTLAEEYDLFDSQTTATVQVQTFTDFQLVQQRGLSEGSPGYDGSARLSLGRFLFRDQENRDHTFDMTVFGGAELQERVGATAALTGPLNGLVARDPFTGQATRANQGLQTPSIFDGSNPERFDDIEALTSFDGADTVDAEYTSRFHSWEWNYNMAKRMRKDRMELLPSGTWVRRASPGFTWNYLAGLRYFDVEERLDWRATNIRTVGATLNAFGLPESETDGLYDIATSNNLFGMQLGAGMTYDTDRWNVTVSTKHGFYINDGRATADLTYDHPDDASVALNNFSTDLHENGISYLATGSIMGRYHLRPNLSLRAGWEFMYVTGLALAPNQANFNPVENQLNLTGDAFYHGVSFGTEYYW